MPILSAISLLSAVFALIMGIVVLQKNPRNPVHVVYLLLSMVIAFVAFAEFDYRQAETLATAQFWLDVNLWSPLIISLITLFVGIYSQSVLFKSKLLSSIILVVPALIFIIIDFFTHSLSGVPVRMSWGWGQTVPHSIIFHVYALWSTLMLTFAAVLAYRYYRARKDQYGRSQAKYVALAITVVVFIVIIIDTGKDYLSVQLPEYSTLGYVFANLLIAYAIWRHQLFEFNPRVASNAIIETMSDALFLLLPDGTIAHINSTTRGMFDIKGTEYLNKPFDYYVKTDTTILDIIDNNVCGVTSEISDVPATIAKKNDQIGTMLSVAGKTIFNKKGKVRGTVVTVRDITDRVVAERELRESHAHLEERVRDRTEALQKSNESLDAERERLAVTLGSIGDGVITTDTSGMVTFINTVAEHITGWKCSEAVGMSIRSVLKIHKKGAPDEELDPVEQALRTGEKQVLIAPVNLITRNGHIRSIDDSVAPIGVHGHKSIGAVIVFRDVTDKERLEEELLRVKRLESVALLAGGIAHDFNNLLTGVNNILFMGKMVASNPDEVVMHINDAEREILRAKKLSEQLLTFAQGGDPMVSIWSPRKIIEESIGFFLSGSTCSYELNFDDDLMNINADRGMMEQVFSNLVINAEQSMENGGTISVSATNVIVGEANSGAEIFSEVLLAPGSYVKIVVGDEGRGIPEEIRDRVFDPFFSTKGKGRGLGLSIALSIIQKHGGTINFSSASTTGTTFSIFLPAVEVSTAEQLILNPINAQKTRFTEKRCHKILLMDDEPVIRLSTAKILGSMGYTVVVASNGEEAINCFREAIETGFLFDLVILDLTVPGSMGGLECLKQLKSIDKRVITIVSSGYSNNDVMAHYRRYGFAGVLKKPYDVARLDTTIQEVIEQEL